MSAQSRTTGRVPRGGATPQAKSGSPRQIPNTDMQDEDTGTAASGNDERASDTQSVMKQTSKTEHEGGSKR